MKIRTWKKIACVLCSEWPKKYEALKEFDNNIPKKEVAIPFNFPRSTLSTWDQPISTIVCWTVESIVSGFSKQPSEIIKDGDDENEDEESD